MAAFEDNYKRYAPMVLGKALRLLGNKQDALDILQEVAMKMHVHQRSFQEMESKTAWLYRVTTNLCLNHLRSRRNQRIEDGVAVETMLARDNPEQQVLSLTRLEAILQRLPAKLHETCIYYFVDGMTQEEIAEVTKCSRISVARYLKQIKDLLKLQEDL